MKKKNKTVNKIGNSKNGLKGTKYKSKRKKIKPGKRRADWEYHHSEIRDAFINIVKEKMRKPTYEEIAERTNLNRKTIIKHVKEIKFEPRQSKFRMLTEDVIMGVYKTAMKGGSASQKLWFQLMEGWKEKTRHEFVDKGMDIDEAASETEALQSYNEMLKQDKKQK